MLAINVSLSKRPRDMWSKIIGCVRCAEEAFLFVSKPRGESRRLLNMSFGWGERGPPVYDCVGSCVSGLVTVWNGCTTMSLVGHDCVIVCLVNTAVSMAGHGFVPNCLCKRFISDANTTLSLTEHGHVPLRRFWMS